MSTYTPGPWKAWDRGIGWEVHGPDDEAVNNGFRETFSEADARLMAAAPELLEALRSLRATCRQAINSGDWKVDGACDPDMDFMRADAVIAKATGEQP